MNALDLIPQREPFLFINEIQNIGEKEIETSMHFSPEMIFFKGHFPDEPIVPGVILNEHCFQSAAAYIAGNENSSFNGKLAVVSRIQSAKFKNLVRPNDTIRSKTILVERLENAAFFKSVVQNQKNQKVLIIEFSVAVVEKNHA